MVNNLSDCRLVDTKAVFFVGEDERDEEYSRRQRNSLVGSVPGYIPLNPNEPFLDDKYLNNLSYRGSSALDWGKQYIARARRREDGLPST